MDILETISHCIDSAIKITSESYDEVLDFSDESIRVVDEILDGYHERYVCPEKDDGFLKGHIDTFAPIFGVYVGEVLRRNYAKDYIWCQNNEFGIVLAKNEKHHVNPIGKCYKQIINGKEGGDDIKSFFDIAILIIQGKIPALRKNPE